MMYGCVLVMIICFVRLSLAVRNYLPTIIIDNHNALNHTKIKANPLTKLSQTYFVEIILNAAKLADTIIIFVENTLSTEELSMKNVSGTPYKNLKKSLTRSQVLYIPAVVEPYKTLIHVFPPQTHNMLHIRNSDDINQRLNTGNFKYMYVFFNDSLSKNNDKFATIYRHDTIISDCHSYLRQQALTRGPLIVFYTGKDNPIQEDKAIQRTVYGTEDPEIKEIMINSRGALFKLAGVAGRTQTRRMMMFDVIPEVVKETWSETGMDTKIAYTDFDLEFHFTFHKDMWALRSVSLLEGDEEVGNTKMTASACWGCSYSCADPLVIYNSRDQSVLTVTKYQVEPRPVFRAEYLEEGPNFRDGKTVFCLKYVSGGICMAFFVLSLILGILFYGFIQLYNCGQNDRFDEVGKGLLISHSGE